VTYHEFRHPQYNQLHKPFIPALSVIDLVCNYGQASLDIILGPVEAMVSRES